MEKTYMVYVHTNRKTGKKYVGMTSLRPKERWQNGRGYSKQKKFFDDILKYGWDNFDHDIVETGLDKDTAKRLEASLIYSLHTYERGYNTFRPEYEEDGTLITSHYFKRSYIPKEPEYLIYCPELDEYYKHATDATKDIGVDASGVLKCCKGLRKSTGKHPETGAKLHWQYAENPDYSQS